MPPGDGTAGPVDGTGLLARLRAAVEPQRVVAGWATVELDRAERELAAGLDHPVASAVDAPLDELLGARCRLIRPTDASEVVLLEPSTEGRLAAALARHDEGWLVTWLVVDAAAVRRAAAAGFRLSPSASGPLGLERLVLGGPRHGPFALLATLERRR